MQLNFISFYYVIPRGDLHNVKIRSSLVVSLLFSSSSFRTRCTFFKNLHPRQPRLSRQRIIKQSENWSPPEFSRFFYVLWTRASSSSSKSHAFSRIKDSLEAVTRCETRLVWEKGWREKGERKYIRWMKEDWRCEGTWIGEMRNIATEKRVHPVEYAKLGREIFDRCTVDSFDLDPTLYYRARLSRSRRYQREKIALWQICVFDLSRVSP